MRQEQSTIERRPKVTMKDVARKVGVNIAAVSVVLNGSKSGTKVSQAKREQILSAAEELGYRPNVLARSLRRQRTGMVGFYSGYDRLTTHNHYLAEILAGVYEGCREHKLDLLLHVWETDAEPNELLRNIADGRVDGMIVHHPPDNPLATGLMKVGIPVVAVTDRLDSVPCVLIDDEMGGKMQADYLLGKGHRRVLYRGSAIPFSSTVERYIAFKQQFEAEGGEVFDGYGVTTSDFPWEVASLRPWELKTLGLRDFEKRLLEQEGITAIAVWDATIAHYTAWELSQAGIRVPEDIAIMGYDVAHTILPPLFDITTIRCDQRQIGKLATEFLASLIEGSAVPAEQKVRPELVVGSTA
ncbi:MAG: LacI family transcriptional regulator [Fimbriimonadaceae bacterium]|jgi:DNA-binding LacI/PurR family transcriptional regulator|nr:LacI family transcriptional regulator [Fimbriimonadaceae bacterium]